MSVTFWLVMSPYGLSPNDSTSHMTIPKLQTSLAEVNIRWAMASGAVHRMGILPPCEREETLGNQLVSLSHASPVLSFKQLTKSFRLGPLHLKWCVITSGEILSKGHKWFWKVILFKPYVQLNATKKKKGCGYKTMTPRTAFLWVTQDSRIIGAFFGWDV